MSLIRRLTRRVPPVPFRGRYTPLFTDPASNAAPAGWTDESYNCAVTWNHVTGAVGTVGNAQEPLNQAVGASSVRVVYSAAYGALNFSLGAGNTFNLGDYDYVTFVALAAQGTTIPIIFKASIEDYSTPGGQVNLGNLPNNGIFKRYDIPISSFGGRAANNAINRFQLQLESGGGINSGTAIFDEFALVKLRERYLPGVQSRDRYDECRPADKLANYWPLMDKATFPQPITRIDSTFNPYVDAVNGDAAGSTEELCQWAARKWGLWPGTTSPVKKSSSGVAINNAYIGSIPCPRGGLNPDTSWILAGLMEMESYWRQEIFTRWLDLSGPPNAPATTRTLCDSGPCQIRSQYFSSGWGGYPGTYYSRAFALDYKGAIFRYLFDENSGAYPQSGTDFPTTRDAYRCLQTFNMGQAGMCGTTSGTDGWNSDYACEILGGVVGSDACAVHGHGAGYNAPGYVNDKHWVADSTFRSASDSNRVVL